MILLLLKRFLLILMAITPLFLYIGCCAGFATVTAFSSSSSPPTVKKSAMAMTTRTTTTTTSSSSSSEQLLEPEQIEVASKIVRLPTDKGTRVRLFYPTTAAAASIIENGKVEADYGTDGRSLGVAYLLTKASSRCIQNGPLLIPNNRNHNDTNKSTQHQHKLLPLLIYSHDIRGNMDIATRLFRSVVLSSRNTIVAAIEHTDGTTSPSTIRNDDDGSKLSFSPYLMTERRQLAWRAQELLDAVQYLPPIINQLQKQEQQEEEACTNGDKENNNDDNDDDSLTRESSVVGHILLGGLGYGATSAVMAANGAPKDNNSNSNNTTNNNNTIIPGLILHDPTLGMGYGMLPPNKAYNRLPTVTYISDKYHYKENVQYGTRTLHMKGCKHDHFNDDLLWGGFAPRWTRAMVDPFMVHEQLGDSMTEFLQNPHDPTNSKIIANGSLFDVIR